MGQRAFAAAHVVEEILTVEAIQLLREFHSAPARFGQRGVQHPIGFDNFFVQIKIAALNDPAHEVIAQRMQRAHIDLRAVRPRLEGAT